jgi:AcrR family transcriptional regulator
VREELKRKMSDRILDGAEQAIGRIGLGKLNMLEVGRSAGVSRGTVYRYFPNREELLTALANREGERLYAHLAEALRNTRTRSDRFEVLMRHAAWHVREHPVLRQLSETDPDFLLRSIRKNFDSIRATVAELVLPLADDLAPVKSGIVTADEFVDWITRILLSAYLFPDPNPERQSRAIGAYMRMLQRFGEQIPEET